MRHIITILALSRKWGGICAAGYDHTKDRVVRLVSNPNGKELEKSFVKGVKLLDVIEAEILRYCPREHQTENILVDTNKALKVTGEISEISDFDFLLNQNDTIFGDSKYKLTDISNLDHSFELVRFSDMSIYVQDEKSKADFYVNGDLHSWYRITDIIHERRNETIDNGYAVITLPPSDDFTDKWGYFKYLAAIFPRNR